MSSRLQNKPTIIHKLILYFNFNSDSYTPLSCHHLPQSNSYTELFTSNMASIHSISQSQLFSKKPQFISTQKTSIFPITTSFNPSNRFVLKSKKMVVAAAGTTAAAEEKSKKRYPGEGKGFVEEMRFVAMKLHTKDQSKEGEKEAQEKPLPKWEPTIDGYLKFLVDSKLVYDTLEKIVDKADFPECKLSLLLCFIL